MRRLLTSAAILLTTAGTAWAQSAPAAGQSKVEELYRQNCQMCHMPDGNAAIEQMNFADGKWIHGSDVKSLVKVITEGVPATAMMPFKDRLTQKQIEALARYVRTFDKNLKPAPKPAGGDASASR